MDRLSGLYDRLVQIQPEQLANVTGGTGLQGAAQRTVMSAFVRLARSLRDQIFTLPLSTSQYMTQSPIRLYNGWRNVAGLFFSNTKWPIQAKP